MLVIISTAELNFKYEGCETTLGGRSFEKGRYERQDAMRRSQSN